MARPRRTMADIQSEISRTNQNWVLIEWNGDKDLAIAKHTCGTVKNFPNGEALRKYSSDKQCESCYSKSLHELFKETIEDLELIEENLIKNTSQKVEVRCKECKHTRKVSYTSIIKNATCSRCSSQVRGEKQRKPEEEINELVYKMLGDNYKYVEGTYQRAKSDMIIHHLVCNRTYGVRLSSVQQGRGCTWCSQSIGERKIVEFLEKNNLTFEPQKRFDSCKNKNTLPFDFYVNTPKGAFLIEFQGIQHFKAVDFFGGQKGLELQQQNDKIKREWCESNGISLIEITYQDEILERMETLI